MFLLVEECFYMHYILKIKQILVLLKQSIFFFNKSFLFAEKDLH